MKPALILVFGFLLLTATLAKAQKVMEFNDVKLIIGSLLVPANVDMSTVPPRDTTITVPVGKIWKIETVRSGTTVPPSTKVLKTTYFVIAVNNCWIYNGTEEFEPFWLTPGTYNLQYYLNVFNTDPVPRPFKFFMNVIEYSTAP